MKTVNLARKRMTLNELIKLAKDGAVRIVTPDGHTLVLEDESEFEKEVRFLGTSKKFRRFLKERSKEPATTTLEEYRKSLK